MDPLDIFVLVNLYYEDSSRSLNSYSRELQLITGTIVSVQTISRLFLHEFPYSARLRRPNVVPIDKFCPENMERAVEYISYVATIDPRRIKYGDEKHLKGCDVFNCYNRRNPFTGLTPPLVAPPDFRNTYSLTGFCGIDRRSSPIFYSIHDGTNDSTEFQATLLLAIEANWFHHGDILVLDNATIHYGGANSEIEDWLWDMFQIIVLFLPPRSPELNPIELVWNTLVQRLNLVELPVMRSIGSNSVAIMSEEILQGMSHEDVEGAFRHAGVF